MLGTQFIADILSSKILRKGLTFVVAVFLVQIIWMAALVALLEQSHSLAEMERQEVTILEHLDTSMILFGQLSGSVANFVSTGSRAWLEDSLQARAKLYREIDTLQRLAPDWEGKAFTDRWRLMTDKYFEQLAVSNPVEETGAMAVISELKLLRPMISGAGTLMKRMIAKINKRRAALDLLRERERLSRQLFTTIVYLGFFVNCIAALTVVTVFLRNITGRLLVLVENAHRLPKRLPLENRVPGDDELSYLDSVLHDAAADLEKAAEHRKSLMQMVAHDLRSPLTSCSIALETTTTFEADSLSPKALDRLKSVQGSIERVVALVNDLLTIDQLELGRLELRPMTFSVSQMAFDAIQSVVGLAQRKNIEIINDCGGEEMTADRDRVLQVVVNYLSNAIKFAPNGSKIELGAQKIDKQVRISVKDEGPGLSKADQKKLFEKFYQTKGGKEAKGFGLGLAICKLIVESHGGRVGVDSEPGHGATFWFKIDDGVVREMTAQEATVT